MSAALQLMAPPKRRQRRTTPLLLRVLARLDVREIHECWRWKGATAGGNQPWDKGGPYGRVRDANGVLDYVHRVILELVGRRCPGDDYVPHHWCRVRLCANPSHLDWVTVEENARLSNECSGDIPF